MKTYHLIGGLLAALVGVAAGILLAPDRGKNTRKNLIKGSLKIKDNVMDYVDDSIGTLRHQVNEKIDQLATRGKETINHVSEKVKL